MKKKATWRPAELIDEAWRRLEKLHLGLAVIIGLLAGGIFIVGTQEITSAFEMTQSNDALGENIYVVIVPDSEHLNAQVCEGLTQLEWIVAAGSSFGENVSIVSTWEPSGLKLPVTDLTDGALRVWWSELPQQGELFAGMDLHQTIGIHQNAVVKANGRTAAIFDLLPTVVTPKLLQASVVRLVPPLGQAKECWFRVLPQTRDAAEPLAQARFPSNTTLTQPFAAGSDLLGDPELQLFTDQAKVLYLGAVGAALSFIGIVALSRRAEVGIYRALGTTWAEIWLMSTLQILILTTTSVGVVTSGLFLWFATSSDLQLAPDLVWYLFSPVAAYMLIVCIFGPLVQTISAAGAIIDTMKS